MSDVNEIVTQNGTYVFFPLDFDIKRIWKQSETQPPMFGSWSHRVISYKLCRKPKATTVSRSM